MDLNLVNILYMFFRMAPFIIVSYFTLQSILNQDLKGVIYLIGLIVTCFIVYLIAAVLPEEKGLMPSDYSKVRCTQLTIGNNYPISKLPLSQTVFGYTLTYWFTCQGSLGFFVILIFWFAGRQEKIDEEFGFAERGDN